MADLGGGGGGGGGVGGGDPGVQRNPPFLAKMNLTHGGVCSLSNRRRRYNVCREVRRSIFRRGSSTLRGKFAPRRNSGRMISTQALCLTLSVTISAFRRSSFGRLGFHRACVYLLLTTPL